VVDVALVIRGSSAHREILNVHGRNLDSLRSVTSFNDDLVYISLKQKHGPQNHQPTHGHAYKALQATYAYKHIHVLTPHIHV
jgi:hypothetical protein